MNVEKIQALIANLRKLVPERGRWVTLAEAACGDAADALESLLVNQRVPAEETPVIGWRRLTEEVISAWGQAMKHGDRNVLELAKNVQQQLNVIAPPENSTGDLLEAKFLQGRQDLYKGIDANFPKKAPEPYGVIVCHKGIPNATQEFIPAQFYREADWGSDYSKVPVYVTPMQWAEPVATLHDDGHYTWHGDKPHGFNYAGWRLKVYAVPKQEM